MNTKRTPVIKGCKFSKRNKKQDKNVSQVKKVMIFFFFLKSNLFKIKIAVKTGCKETKFSSLLIFTSIKMFSLPQKIKNDQ